MDLSGRQLPISGGAVGPLENNDTNLDADRGDDVTFFAVLIFQKRQTGRSDRIVFNRRDRRLDAVLGALEVHDTDFLLVTAADAASCDATILRPPVFLRGLSTSDFSGLVLVISLKSATVDVSQGRRQRSKCLDWHKY